jgi:uncharacterized membrane protein YfcA
MAHGTEGSNSLVGYGLFGIAGMLVGVASAFSGLGGGFLMVPLLVFTGYSAQRAVGTSLLAILMIATSALFAHHRFDHVDWRVGMALGLGGVLGAPLGARLVAEVPTASFKRIFAVVLAGLALWLFFDR